MKPTINYTLLTFSLIIFLCLTLLISLGYGQAAAVASCFSDGEDECREQTSAFSVFLPYVNDGLDDSINTTVTPTVVPTVIPTLTPTATATPTNTPTPTNTATPPSRCHVFPIGMSYSVRSLTNEFAFPDTDQFSYPASPPSFYELIHPAAQTVAFSHADEGDIFLVQLGHDLDGFVWLTWNEFGDDDVTRLSRSLDWPGNSTNYRDTTTGSWPAELQELYGSPDPVVGYINPHDYTDSILSVGDAVLTYSDDAYHADMIAILSEHVDRERVLPMLLWTNDFNAGSFSEAEVADLVVWGRIIGFRLEPGDMDSWLLIETVVIDDDCVEN